MRKIALLVLLPLASAVSTPSLAQGLAGFAGAAEGYQRAQAQRLEMQRLQLCNQAMQRYLHNGGPPPPAMCQAPAAAPAFRAPPVTTTCRSHGSRLECTTE
jgi:hypothetical protein